MAESTDDNRPDDEPVEGGAVKSFLEHLEDLRWVLIKSSAATLLAMFVCLFNANRLVAILKWPLHQAAHRHILLLPDSTNQIVTVQFGNMRLGTMEMTSNFFGTVPLGTNHYVVLNLVPVQKGDENVLALRVAPGVEDSDDFGPQLVYLDPADPFLSSIHIAFFAGLILASPFVLYYIGQFVMPALKIKEKKAFFPAFCIGVFLFFAGVSTAYFAIMPAALKFAEQYSVWLGVSVPLWTFSAYASFVVKFMLGMGLGFELPVALLALVKIGLLDYQKLSSMRRYMIVGNLIIGALLTTPEVITQVVMAVVLQFLYEVSVWIAWYWERQEKKLQKS